jgi:type I restriction enzyme S subunit
MSLSFPMVLLGEILTKSDEWIDINPNERYRQVTVRLWGKGVVLREEVSGAEIAASKRLVVHPQQFILSRIDARNGAFGLIPVSLDGAVVSSDFPVFTVNPLHIIPKYLDWMSKTHFFIDICKAASEGTTNRIRLKEGRFLATQIPLPPLTEQRRIVVRIEELAAKVEDARGLRRKAGEEVEAFLASSSDAAFKKQSNWGEARVGDFCETPQYGYTESATSEQIGPRFLRITDIQNGLVDWDNVPFCNCPDPEKYLLMENDLVFARTGATTGKSFLIRKCPKAVFASYLIRLRVKHSVSVEYLYRYFQTPSYWAQITDEKKGTGQPNVNGKKLANIRVPVPPLPQQRRIVAYLDSLQAKVDALRRLQAETGAELDALMPAVLDRAFKGGL